VFRNGCIQLKVFFTIWGTAIFLVYSAQTPLQNSNSKRGHKTLEWERLRFSTEMVVYLVKVIGQYYYYYYYYQCTDLSDIVTRTMQGHFTES